MHSLVDDLKPFQSKTTDKTPFCRYILNPNLQFLKSGMVLAFITMDTKMFSKPFSSAVLLQLMHKKCLKYLCRSHTWQLQSSVLEERLGICGRINFNICVEIFSIEINNTLLPVLLHSYFCTIYLMCLLLHISPHLRESSFCRNPPTTVPPYFPFPCSQPWWPPPH